MSKDTCAQCKHWKTETSKGSGKTAAMGECRRFPPTLMFGFFMSPKTLAVMVRGMPIHSPELDS